jgi:8-oxo-dGTP pyrophosphatase MutT (NUDIX family)
MHNSAQELVQLVDENNQPCGSTARSDMRAQGLIYRGSFIYVFNDVGEIYLQKRAATKDMYPSWFDAAAGGVLRPDESYQDNAIREAEEELGVINAELEVLEEFFFEDGTNRLWGKLFILRHEGPFTFPDGEVEYGMFVSPQAVLDGQYTPVTPDSLWGLQRLVSP